MTTDIFESSRRPATLLLVSVLLELANAHVVHNLPRQTPAPTITLPYHVLNVVSWPLRPTPPPRRDLFALRQRQSNTVCGYIGGDSALPATCDAGSHCVLDTEHNVIGCCPDGVESCTTGVFTGCVDGNSGPQTEANPYVYSCSGGAVCYKNVFDGGYSQWGCGTASDLATTVRVSASGVSTALDHPTVTVSFTQSVTSLDEPTTLGTVTNVEVSSTSSLTSASLSSTTTSSSRLSATTASSLSSQTSITRPSSTSPDTENADVGASSTSAPSASTNANYRTGAIVGGTIGGLAVLIALISLVFFVIRRRSSNVRKGPGPGGIRSQRISPPKPQGGTGFAALTQDADAFEVPSSHTLLHYNPNPMTMSKNAPSLTATGAATAIASGALPAESNNASNNPDILPPINAGPSIPFQTPADDLDHDHSPYAYRGAESALAGSAYQPPSGYAPGSSTAYSYPVMGRTHAANDGFNSRLESDQVPLTRAAEFDEFHQGFQAALDRIGEEDEDMAHEPYRDNPTGSDSAAGNSLVPPSSRPLWQQNRRQSRNMMWM
ncbi:uncharacterized protein CTHT_0036470 [Thermochaetoides thermophila DSM 1495]|uniref:Mid2 domain-containing protein n=1 Tax=Chaetomium thermophilum (strain DSM 1495 / CBS 144.50 / IMI 039719) TaxID=759272 RepID=G0S7D5_CHATD|nr:hypothetical protein CTHT_0036470 [Thermochaetoides thermophila DSM 1495]EGS21779.1 hypothetical protein CTHT_0036470 [Thermochaetoides thermophila DSM 1495]